MERERDTGEGRGGRENIEVGARGKVRSKMELQEKGGSEGKCKNKMRTKKAKEGIKKRRRMEVEEMKKRSIKRAGERGGIRKGKWRLWIKR